jgi:mono/diheme cytochrome c family protein
VDTFIKPKEEDEMKSALTTLALTLAVGTLLMGLASGADVAKGKAAFQQYCASCHGATGKGDGSMGARLNPKLKDLSDKAFNSSMKDDYLAKLILEGGKAVGKSPMMPKMGATLKESDAADIIAFMRSLAK